MAAITLIGSGKAATALGKALVNGGHRIIQVWSRTADNAAQLAQTLKATPVTDLSEINNDADIYIVAVKDDAIEDIAKHLHVGDKLIAHTSGIKSRELLNAAGGNYGIFYPFISMAKDTIVDFRKALIMIEGSNKATSDALFRLAYTISYNVKVVDETQRQSLHLAAVFANNFTNHMYTIAAQILQEKGLSFDDLKPLISAHLQNVISHPPAQLQTGPAIRGDQSTIDIHQKLLGHDENLKKLYSLLTSSIQDYHKKGS